MIAGKAHLGWVKKYLTELLDDIAHSLQAAEEDPHQGYTAAAVGLNNLRNSLRLVRADGAATLAAELWQATRYTAEHDPDSTESLSRLLEGVVNLRDYLDHVNLCGHDQAMVLVSLINDLRARRGESLLHEGKLFFPELDRPLPSVDWPEDQQRPTLSELRKHWQRALRDWLKAEEAGKKKVIKGSSKALAKAARQLYQAHAEHTEQQRIWLLTAMVMQAVADGCRSPDVNLPRLLARVDVYLGQQMHSDTEGEQEETADSLSRALLYFAASCDQEHPDLDTLKDHYDLHQLVDKDILNAARQSLKGRNRDLESSVAVAVLEELQSIKDRIDHLQHQSKDADIDVLESHHQALSNDLQRLSSSLLMLSQPALASRLGDIAGMIDSHVSQQRIMPESELLDLAGLLLDVEAQLASSSLSVEDALPAGLNAGTYQVLNLAINNLDLAQQTMDTLLRSKDSDSSTKMPERLLNEAAGALDMANRAANATDLRVGVSYLRSMGLQAEQADEADHLAAFAAMLAALERFLITLRDGEANHHLEQAAHDYAQQLEGIIQAGQSADDEAEDLPAAGERQPQPQPEQVSADATEGSAEETVFEQSESTAEGADSPLDFDAGQPDPEFEIESHSEAQTQALPDSGQDTDNEADATEAADNADTVAVDGESSDSAESDLIAEAEPGGEQPDSEASIEIDADQQIPEDDVQQAAVDHGDEHRAAEFETTVETGAEADSSSDSESSDDDVDIDQSVQTELADSGSGADDQPQAITDSIDQPAVDSPDEQHADLAAAQADEPAQPAPDQSRPWQTDAELRSIFLVEFDDMLETLAASIPLYLANPQPGETLSRIRRAFHTIKGSARMVDAGHVGELGKALEFFLNAIIDSQAQPPEASQILTQAIPALQQQRQWLQQGLDATNPAEQDLLASCSIALRNETDEVIEQDIPADTVASAELLGPEPLADADDLVDSELAVTAADDEKAVDPQLLALIREELYRHAQTLSDYLDIYARQSWAPIPDAELIRALHTLAGTLSLAPLGDEPGAVQKVEQYLTELRDLERAPDVIGMRLLAAVHELLQQRLSLLDEQGAQAELDTADIHRLNQQVSDVLLQQNQDDTDSFMLQLDDQERVGDAINLTASLADPFALAESDQASPDAVPTDSSQSEQPDDGQAGDDQTDSDEQAAAEEQVEADHYSETESAHTADSAMPGSEPNAADRPGHVPPDEDAADRDDDDYPGMVRPTIPIDYTALDESLVDVFLEESSEVMLRVDECMQRWMRQGDFQVAAEIRRCLHTLKGGARMAGLDPVGELSHELETVLELSAPENTDMRHLRLLQGGFDDLHDMLAAAAQRQPLPQTQQPELADLADSADSYDVQDAPAQPDHFPQAAPAGESDSAVRETLRVNAQVIDHLTNVAGEVSIFRARLAQEISGMRGGVNEVEQTVSRLRDQLRKLELETEAQILSRHQYEAEQDAEFDPLELDRYSTIQQLSRALAESVNDLLNLQESLEHGTRQSEAILVQQSRVNTELQDGLLQTRMVSFGTLAPRLRQVVRRAAQESGKPANLELFIAEDGQLDRNMLEQINAPLEHMLRNAVAHGIEPAGQRRKAGKPVEGLINIRVFREATELVIQLRDDGRGLDSQRILQHAVERELISAEAELSEHEVRQLIFIPGFSTADGVSELAGRGVGMDVVRSTVRQIGGSLELNSEPGQGTEFIIRIPMTLTVMQAVMVDLDDRQFAIPVGNVLGVTKLPSEEYLRCFEQGHLSYAGADNPLLELETMLGFNRAPVPKGMISIVVLEAGGQRAAIRIPELRRHQELVIKPLGPQLTSIPGILAGAISGEGQVILILDMGPLIRRSTATDVTLPSLAEQQQQEVRRQPLVLVVDDSITVRKVTSRVLEQHQLEVMTARDGIDALEVMSDRVPDLILLDIEMPRMDGFELSRYVRSDARLRHIPIIIISSRSGEKHQQTAQDVGANHFLGKPYQEKELLRQVDLLLDSSPNQDADQDDNA